MRPLVLVRHATTDPNVVGQLTSTTDVPLNAQGRRDAAQLACYLASAFPGAAIWSSPARRARETAGAFEGMTGTEALVVEEAREVDFGPFEGFTRTELTDRSLWRAYSSWAGGEAVTGAESLAEAAARAHTLCQLALEQLPPRGLVIVSHGVFLRVMICAGILKAAPTTFRRLTLDNASVSVIHVDGTDVRVSQLNNRSFLAASVRDPLLSKA